MNVMPSKPPVRFSRRTFLGVASVAATGALVIACSSPTATSTAPTAAPTHATKPTGAPPSTVASPVAAQPTAGGTQVTLRYGTFWPQYRLDIMSTGLKVFEGKWPNIKISLEGSGSQFSDKLTTQLASGTAPDTAICDGSLNILYADQGQALDVTDRLRADNIDITKLSWINGYEILSSKVFAMPWVLSPHAWYFNKTMLKQAGAKDPWDDLKGEWTWADFRDMLLKVTALPPKDGKIKIYGAKLGLDQMAYQLCGFIFSNGGHDYTLQPFQYTFDDPKLIEACEFVYNTLFFQDKTILPPDQATALSQGGVTDPFSAGIVGFMEDSTGRLTITRDSVKNAFEWDVVRMPKASASSGPSRANFAANANFIYSKTPNPDDAYLALKFLAGYSMPDMQVILAQQKLLLPSLKTAGRNQFNTPPPVHVSSFITGGFTSGELMHYKVAQTDQLMTTELDKAILGQQTIRQTLLNLNPQLNKLIEIGKSRQFDTSNYSFDT